MGAQHENDGDALTNRPTDLDSPPICAGVSSLHFDKGRRSLTPRPSTSTSSWPLPSWRQSMSPKASTLDQQVAMMAPASSVKKVELMFTKNNLLDNAFDVNQFISDPTNGRKRNTDFDEFISDPTPNKRRNPERRRGRPRKEEIAENEDLRTVAKRMYARAYRENMKHRYVETEEELQELKDKYSELKVKHEKLEKLVEQCNFCTSSWALVKSMNIDPAVLRMAYDTLSNIRKTPSPARQRSSSRCSSK